MVEHGNRPVEDELVLGYELSKKGETQCVGVTSHGDSEWLVAGFN